MESVFEPGLRALATRLHQALADPVLAAATLRRVRDRAPDERLAMAFMLRLDELCHPVLLEALRDQSRADDLIFCLGGSELIADGLIAIGSGWVEAFDQTRSARSSAPGGAAVGALPRSPSALGEFKRRALVEIAIADLLGRRTVMETVHDLSRLAVRCIDAALAIASRELAAASIANNFCVLAMGKLGANELNLSSDIDLIYIFHGSDLDQISAAQRLGERLTEILSNHCFRVDLRLRPGGRAAPLVCPAEWMLSYYQSLGETWERAALLRARPVAGAIAAGDRLIAELSRFIYRAYLDFDTLGELRRLKRQIEAELRSPELVTRNLKLGYGGIRELEFIVHALALIYGGRDPHLRTRNTVAMLERLESRGYMAAARARALRDAYLFLRNAEHKLQIAAGLQTHTLPSEPRAISLLAARLGYGKDPEAAGRFLSELKLNRDLVADQFRDTLRTHDTEPAPPSPIAEAAWDAAHERDLAGGLLAKMGFARPEEAARNLDLLARDPPHRPRSARRRAALERLGPLLIDEIRELADPDLALLNLASFIIAVGARTSFLAVLQEQPATRHVLLRLFASSAYLSALFITHPAMIDSLVKSDLVRPRRTPPELAAELHALAEVSGEFESYLDALRGFRHQEFLRIAIADLAGALELPEVREQLTRLAEIILREALTRAQLEVQRRYPIPPGLRIAVMAMGRLAAAEMSYNSDLDLIFVYSLPSEVAAGGREAASRVVQKLIAILSAPTREGYAYKIDLRLRPSGNAGPLVASLDGFDAYHQLSSALWERQAMVRGRVIAGDQGLGDEVEAARHRFVFDGGLDSAGVGEIAAMRARIERELGGESVHRLNLKQGAGGILDIEFLTQMMALRYGREFTALQEPGTIALLRAIGDSGLMPIAEIGELEADYDFLSRLENRLRIESDQAVSALPTDLAELNPIARRAGYEGSTAAEDLLRDLADRRRRVRVIFESCFIRERAR